MKTTKMMSAKNAVGIYFVVSMLLANVVVGEIYTVTQDNYQRYFKTKTGAIFLYMTTPNCDLCDLFYYKFVTVSQVFANRRDVSFGRVKDSVLAEALDIKSFPEVAYYEAGSASPQIYGDAITPVTLSQHVASVMKINPTDVGVRYTVGLTSANFKEILLTTKQHRLVMLHRTHDMVEYDAFDEVAEVFANEYDIVIATLNVDRQTRLKETFLANSYPAFYWYAKGTVSEKKRYGGQLIVNHMISFINEECGFFRTKDGTLNSKAGLIAPLDDIVAEHAKDLYEIKNLDLLKMKLKKATAKLPVDTDMDLAEFYVHIVDEVEEDRTIDALTETRSRIYRNMLGAGPFSLDQMYRKKNIVNRVLNLVTDSLNGPSKRKKEAEQEQLNETSHAIVFHDEF